MDFRINPRVEKFWDGIVKHQGWLLKLGGGVKKTWMKRYAVLYSTAMGHFLCYYSDFAKSPLFHSEERERRVIDLSKTTFVRPVSNNKEAPLNSFDICTIEREWTLSAESKASMQQWLQVITRAIDEDVAIVPDDELLFLVKPRVDPTGKLLKNEYSTALKVSASGVAVCHVANNDEYQERFFWCYTDFFKWSILHHSGKTGLQVSIFTSTDFDVKDRQEFLFRTREAVKLATAIEFYIEKFMAAQHLFLEGGLPQEKKADTKKEDTLIDGVDDIDEAKKKQPATMSMKFSAKEMGQDALVTDDLIGVEEADDDDDDDFALMKKDNNRPQQAFSLLDIFTVDAEDPSSSETFRPGTFAPDDPFAPKPYYNPNEAFVEKKTNDLNDSFVAPMPQDEQSVVSDLTASAQQNPSTDDLFFSVGPPAPFVTAETNAFDSAPPEPTVVPQRENDVPAVVVDATESMINESPLFDALTRLNESEGVLFENNAITVSVLQEYRGSQGRVTIKVRNDYPPRDQGGNALEEAEIEVDVGDSGLRHHLTPLTPSTVEPLEEATSQLMIECMQPFDEAPAAYLKFFIDGQRYELKIALPSVFTKFLEPVDLAPQVFVQRWATLAAEGLETMNTFRAKAGTATADFAKPRLETLVNLAFATGVDDNNGTILSAAGALRTGTANAGGDKISVGCLVRLEMNQTAGAYRLTVRTAVPQVSQSLAQAIIAVL